jgi:DHA1 family bicyclomycin/chloramphenicol resistance-like MFS transporter
LWKIPDLTAASVIERTPPRILTLVLLAGVAMLSMNAFLPSLPAMSVHFETDYAFMQLSISGYLAMTAILQLAIGPLSDRYGRRPVLLWSLLLFVAASVGCIFATSIEMFLFFRMVQAAVASGMVLSRAIIRDMVEPSKAASMIGYVTVGIALVPMIGPILGGLIEQTLGWQAVFWLFVASGLGVYWLVWVDLGETNANRSASFAAQFRTYPELFGSRRFWGYTVTAAFASGAFFAFLGGGPIVAVSVFHLTPAESGFSFGFISVGYMIGNFFTGRYASAMGVNKMMMIGTSITAAGMVFGVALVLVGIVTPYTMFGSIFFVGLGNGLTMPSSNAGILSVRPHLAGSASGLGGAMMIGGGAALSAITGALLGPDTGPMPMLLMMLLSATLAWISMLYVLRVERMAGPLKEPEEVL